MPDPAPMPDDRRQVTQGAPPKKRKPTDWTWLGKEWHDNEVFRREAARSQFAKMAKGIPKLEAHLAAWPKEYTGIAQIRWIRECEAVLASLAPRLGRWRNHKAHVPNYRYSDYNYQWPDEIEDWQDISELAENGYPLEDVYCDVPEFKRRCDAVWLEQREDAIAKNRARFKWLLSMAFWKALHTVRLVGVAKWRNAKPLC